MLLRRLQLVLSLFLLDPASPLVFRVRAVQPKGTASRAELPVFG